jgi:hypothetical protein
MTGPAGDPVIIGELGSGAKVAGGGGAGACGAGACGAEGGISCAATAAPADGKVDAACDACCACESIACTGPDDRPADSAEVGALAGAPACALADPLLVGLLRKLR